MPKDVPIEMLGPLGCALQTGVGGVFYTPFRLNPAHLLPYSAETGSVGVSAIMAAVVSGATKIIVVSRSDEKMKNTLQFGATHLVNSGKCDPVEEIRKITGGGADYSLECTAIPEILSQAVDCLRMGGKCGLIGAAPMGVRASLDMQRHP
jgi:aryl-alcohol dehydrogenase